MSQEEYIIEITAFVTNINYIHFVRNKRKHQNIDLIWSY